MRNFVWQMDAQLENIKRIAGEQFMKLGIRAVSMDDISSVIGISKKTLYQYISNKEELVDSCVTEFIQQEKNMFLHLRENSVDAIDEMSQIARYIVSLFRQMRPTLLIDLKKYYTGTWHKITNMQSKFVKEQIKNNLERGIQEGYYRSNIDPEIISSLYVEKAFSITSDSIFPPHKFDSDKLIEQHMLYHLYGILSEEGIAHFNKIKLFNS